MSTTSNPNNPEEFYNKLREQLYGTSSWPTKYLYKFILPSNKEKLESLENIFNNMGAVIDTKASKSGKYTSVSVNLIMQSPELVIEKYKEVAEKIEGVISL